MKNIYLICFLLLASIEMVTAQTTTTTSATTVAAPPPPRARRNMDQPDPNAPATKYDYRDAFAPFFYTKNGNEYRAATGEPGPKYWQNRADYKLDVKLNEATNEIAGTEI